MKFGQNFVTTWSRKMVLVSNLTKMRTSYSLKLSEILEKLSNFSLHCVLLKYIKILCVLQAFFNFCSVFLFVLF